MNPTSRIRHRVRSRAVALAVAVAGVAGAIAVAPATGTAGATGDPLIGMEVLDRMCAARRGTPVSTPFTISRCEAARGRRAFETERLVCEGLLGGTFSTVPNVRWSKRTNWFCFPGAI